MSAPTGRPDEPNLGARGEWLARVSEAASGILRRATRLNGLAAVRMATYSQFHRRSPLPVTDFADLTFVCDCSCGSRSKLAVYAASWGSSRPWP